MKVNGPGQSTLLLLEIVPILNKLNIPYAIVGAFAASFYGAIRASLDADAIISVDGGGDKLKDLLTQLRKEKFKVDFIRGDSEDPVTGVINIQDTFHNRIDLLLGIRGMGIEAFERTVQSSFMGAVVKFIGLEDFIAMKVFAGSPKDIQDIIGALQVSKGKINLLLLKKLTLNFGKSELKKLEAILKEHY